MAIETNALLERRYHVLGRSSPLFYDTPLHIVRGQGAHVWDVMGRGFEAGVITDLDQPWGSSVTCTSCGKCVQVCPTGALFIKGRAVGEMVKNPRFLTSLAQMRETLK